MNILLLTPIYPGTDTPKDNTPVVHYFSKEWLLMGHTVKVIHYPVNFPKIVYCIAKYLESFLSNLFSSTVRVKAMAESSYTWENVEIKRIPLKKFKPHSRYHSKEIEKAAQKTIGYCNDTGFTPDIIIGHWVNPQLEIMQFLKKEYKTPCVLVMHDSGRDFSKIYQNDYQSLLSHIDIIGFRSKPIKKMFEEKYGLNHPWFYCFSGIPEYFIDQSPNTNKFLKLNKFLFAGTLIKRKYPSEIINALMDVFPEKDFELKYIGKGHESKKINNLIAKNNLQKQIKAYGRIDRSELKKYYHEAEIFIMISKNETFGLVYLEAMASGCITIASRNEGYDGIIIDGVNGFLCKAGDINELSSIIKKIRRMPLSQIQEISKNAIETACSMTDRKMAEQYLDNIKENLARFETHSL